LHSIVHAARTFEEIDYYPRVSSPTPSKGTGEVWQGWTEKNQEGMTILHWYRLNMTGHWYQPGDSPALETTTMCAHISTRRGREKLAEHLK
jgi:hypothetical protein